MLTNRPGSCQAHLRSHSCRNAGVGFAHAPTTAEKTIPPHLVLVLLLERARQVNLNLELLKVLL